MSMSWENSPLCLPFSVAVTSTGRDSVTSKAEAEKVAPSVTSGKALAFKYSFKGTPVFMSPEVVSDQNYSRKSDVWGVGCTLIQMATGNPPYSEFTNHFAALFAIADKDAPPPQVSHLSPLTIQSIQFCFTPTHTKRASTLSLSTKYVQGAYRYIRLCRDAVFGSMHACIRTFFPDSRKQAPETALDDQKVDPWPKP